jgi:pimeloyl-ACP methyl ester carboxylesterase
MVATLKSITIVLLSCLVLTAEAVEGDDTQNKNWPKEFTEIKIPNSLDGVEQAAFYRATNAIKAMPLVVNLHTWSGDYTQKDPLAPFFSQEDWNYIHPDFRGPNKTPDACMSEKVIPDIDDAIAYAIKNGKVDQNNIFVIGASGGGYATLGCFLRLKHRVNTFLAWVPISDLEAWYWQSNHRNSNYADDILKSTSQGDTLNAPEARRRSPLFWDLPAKPNGKLEIYAGIRDGYEGSVPISHSILFYNKVATHFGDPSTLVTPTETIQLLSQGTPKNQDLRKLHETSIFFSRQTGPVTLTIFDGKHEMLEDACITRLKELSK